MVSFVIRLIGVFVMDPHTDPVLGTENYLPKISGFAKIAYKMYICSLPLYINFLRVFSIKCTLRIRAGV
jgi:hypothetical protein